MYVYIYIYIYIYYILNPLLRNLNTDFTLNNFFVSVELTENADPDKKKYSGYGIGFYFRSGVLFLDGK